MACGDYIGHEDCNYTFVVQERQGHKADRDSWKRSKNHKYKKKMANQQKGK